MKLLAHAVNEYSIDIIVAPAITLPNKRTDKLTSGASCPNILGIMKNANGSAKPAK